MAKETAKAPSGNWEMPDEQLASALGYFVMSWSCIEAAIEIGIHKQIERTPLFSSIMTASLMHKTRSAILSSLLSRFPDENRDAIAALDEIGRVQDRNDIMHSVIGGSRTQIWFNRRVTASKFSSKIEYYDRHRLLVAAQTCSQLATRLMAALGITPADYADFFQDAHNAANKL